MTRLCKRAFAGLAISLGVMAQSLPRNWASRAEYRLGTKALQERDPNRQITLLRQWQVQYPQSDFKRERTLSSIQALGQRGLFDASFALAAELLKLDRYDPEALVLIVALGPSLPAPSASQMAVVMDSVSKLQSLKMARSLETEEPTVGLRLLEPNSQVLAFVRELRREHDKANLDPDVFRRRLIESALAWAKDQKPK